MTQEEKELLLKDLCARLPYGVIIHTFAGDFRLLGIDEDSAHLDAPVYEEGDDWFTWEHACKPYLRPMESMSEEERKELSDYLCEQVMPNKIGITIPPNPTQGKGIPFRWMGDCINWLNKKMFDYSGLIPMGLALPAKEGMYN